MAESNEMASEHEENVSHFTEHAWEPKYQIQNV